MSQFAGIVNKMLLSLLCNTDVQCIVILSYCLVILGEIKGKITFSIYCRTQNRLISKMNGMFF